MYACRLCKVYYTQVILSVYCTYVSDNLKWKWAFYHFLAVLSYMDIPSRYEARRGVFFMSSHILDYIGLTDRHSAAAYSCCTVD